MALDSVLSHGQVGPGIGADGTQKHLALTKSGLLLTAKGGGDYAEAAARSRVYSLALLATTTGVAAGNIAAAAAAASTNFALFNPVGSGKIFSLLKFGYGIISGTPAGPLFHGLISTGVPTVAATGSAINHATGKVGGSSALHWATAAGTTLTGGGAPTTLRLADFSSTATAQASVNVVPTIEYINGDIILQPGMGWVPLHSAAGTSLLTGYSITWEEIAQP
jgi:hypothetical protein